MLSLKDYQKMSRTENDIKILRILERQLIQTMNKLSINEMVEYAKLLDENRRKIDFITYY